MNAKLESIERRVKRGGRGGGGDLLETLAQESFDILTLLPTYIDGAKDAVDKLAKESAGKMDGIEQLLVDDSFKAPDGTRKSLAKVKQSLYCINLRAVPYILLYVHKAW